MHIGFFNYYEIYNNNRMFQDSSSPIGDDLIYPMVYLGRRLRELGHTVSTIDIGDLKSFDMIFFLDLPDHRNRYLKKLIDMKFDNLNLILLESPIIRPKNWDPKNHASFRKIFTWDDRWVDNKRYFRFFLPNKIPNDIIIDPSKKSKFCTMISGNKYVSSPLELYTERIKAIRWFEENHPEDFDLYGFGWERYLFTGRFSILNRLDFLRSFLKPNYISYRGSIKSKKNVLQNYKFSICYENALNINGYITEKIFDCLFSGCVPIYLGAPDITTHIPENAFIDMRRFDDYDDLYAFIKNMPNDIYLDYLANIQDLFRSGRLYPFSAECFADTIISHLNRY